MKKYDSPCCEELMLLTTKVFLQSVGTESLEKDNEYYPW